MTFYNKVALFGCTSGIGKALAERLVESSSFVIAIGRRKGNLEDLVQKYGADKVQAYEFDITKLVDIEAFAQKVTSAHPDLDCVFLNSGIQRALDFAKPETVDLEVVKEEFTTNYLSYIALVKAFLPFLLGKDSRSALAFTTSGLALIPSPRVPNYSASKAAMHSFIMTLRAQLAETKIKVIELIPPAVQTELHDEKHQPDLGKSGSSFGMPLAEFTDAAWAGLTAGQEEVAVQFAKTAYDAIEPRRQELFRKIVGAAKAQATGS